MKFFRLILLLSITFALIWASGMFLFIWQIPKTPENSIIETDAIVVLTGGSERMEEGLRLLSNNYAVKLFVSGAGRGVIVADLSNEKNLNRRIDIGHSARDTRENAIEVSKWVEQNGYRSLRLVTSNYHMARSILELKSAMPDITLIAHPVFPDNVMLDKWWKFPGAMALISM